MPSEGAGLGPGDITALGLLYEGSDYAQWDSRMNKILKWHSYGGFLDVGHRSLTPTDAMSLGLESVSSCACCEKGRHPCAQSFHL